MRDLFNQIVLKRAIAPAAAVTDNTAFVSQIADTANGDSLTFLGIAGSLSDANMTTTVLVEEGNDSGLSDAAAVADADLLGLEASCAPQYDSDNKCFKIGYKGSKRYVRVTITPAANTGDIYLAGIWLHGSPRVQPQSTQLAA